MATEGRRRLHLFPVDTSTTQAYTAPRARGPSVVVPAQNRPQHASFLRAQLVQLEAAQQQRIAEQRQAGVRTSIGIQVEFESMQGVAVAAASLARDNRGIELLNVRQQDDTILATVFVPPGKFQHFHRLLDAYVNHRVDRRGRPVDHQKLIDAIRRMHAGTFDSLWTDTRDVLPADEHEAIWWEAWLPVRGDRAAGLADFHRFAGQAGLQTRERALHFPERSVVLMHGTKAQLLQSPLVLEAVVELRRAKDTAEFFDSLDPIDQGDWLDNLRQRIRQGNRDGEAPYVTLLDTGVNHAHPLLATFTAAADMHTVEPGWGTADHHGHGTQLAGLALHGDLTPALSDESVIEVGHRLESVKLLQRPGSNQGESFGALTAEAVSRVEVVAAQRRRVFSMAVSSTDGRDRGRPSSWSAALDRLASDYENDGASPRLFVVSAGNTSDMEAWAEYPESLSTNAIHDPAQAWNALTVGAYSQLTLITDVDAQHYQAVAPVGGLSPYTTTSATWHKDWPFKPDIVMEGGNTAVEPNRLAGFACSMHSLSLLTTNSSPAERLLDTCWATSAANALASRVAAELWAAYPRFWPETVRGLLVHSARWTPAMLDTYLPNRARNRQSLTNLLRHCGYGVPDLERALWSAANSLTMIIQDELQPYHKAEDGGIKTRDMHLHDLPWPAEILSELGETEVTLRVTLSYFIEPNPGDRGASDKYAYQSHALRFAVRRPLETEAAFRARINAQSTAEEADELPPSAGPADPHWFIGERLRRRGSVLSDSWTGSAAALAERGQLAVYPTMGWWRKRPALNRYERIARYAMLVSIEAPEVTQDLYAAVQLKIEQAAVVAT